MRSEAYAPASTAARAALAHVRKVATELRDEAAILEELADTLEKAMPSARGSADLEQELQPSRAAP